MSRDPTRQRTPLSGSQMMGAACHTISYEEHFQRQLQEGSSTRRQLRDQRRDQPQAGSTTSRSSSSTGSSANSITQDLLMPATHRRVSRKSAILWPPMAHWSTSKTALPAAAGKVASLVDATTSLTATPKLKTGGLQHGGTVVGGMGGDWAGWSWGGGDADADTQGHPQANPAVAATSWHPADGSRWTGEPERAGGEGCHDNGRWGGDGADSLMC